MSTLRLLFWLKWKLLFRSYRGNSTAVMGVILLILFFVPASLGIAIALGAAFLSAPNRFPEHILRAVLLGIYLMWLLGPLLGYGLNDSYDITKLFVYPISVRQIFTGAILGSVVDLPVLMLMPTLLAVIVGFTRSLPALPLEMLAVGLFLFHTLALSQSLILASAGILRSRRFRDVLMVIVPLFWMGYYFLSQSFSRRLLRINLDAFLNGPTWDALNFLPSGLAARSVAAAGEGNYAASLAYCAVLAIVTVATVYLAGWLVQMAFAGAIGGPSSRRKKREPEVTGQLARAPSTPSPATAHRSRASIKLPPVVQAIIDKELKYYARDPYFKLTLMNLVYVVFVAVIIFAGGRRAESEYRPPMVWGATGMILLSQMGLVFNVFGTEGPAAAVLFTFPSSRRLILIGKNLVLFAALSVVNLAVILVLTVIGGALGMFGSLFVWMELGLAVFIAVGNLASIWFPNRIVMRGNRLRQTGLGGQASTRGCIYSLLYLPLMAATMAILLPILAALMVPTFFVSSIWLVLTIPLATAYAAGIYLLSLKLAEPLLLQRELAIVEKVAATE